MQSCSPGGQDGTPGLQHLLSAQGTGLPPQRRPGAGATESRWRKQKQIVGSKEQKKPNHSQPGQQPSGPVRSFPRVEPAHNLVLLMPASTEPKVYKGTGTMTHSKDKNQCTETDATEMQISELPQGAEGHEMLQELRLTCW